MDFRRIITAATSVLLLFMVATLAAPFAEAQAPPPADVAATCGDLAVLSIPEGPFAIEAAESLRQRGAPNPPGIDAALDVIVAAADFDTDSPDVADIDAALATLTTYFGGACDGLDRCGFIAQIAGNDDAVASEAAHLLRRIETPSPPGIDAALALIAGDVTESPFHADVDEARAQVLSYYPCGISDGGEGGPDEGGPDEGDGDGGEDNGATGGDSGDGSLAFTGGSTGPIAAVGVSLVVAGALVLRTRRRLD